MDTTGSWVDDVELAELATEKEMWASSSELMLLKLRLWLLFSILMVSTLAIDIGDDTATQEDTEKLRLSLSN